MKASVLLSIALLVASPAIASGNLPGTYSMSGVAGAGGELELGADGRYRWSVSTDSVNRSSSGKWVRNGQRITLSPDNPENPSGIARSLTPVRWDDEAERQYLRINFENEWAQVLARCPLLRVRIPAFVAPEPDASKNWRGEAGATLQKAVAARRAAVQDIALWNKTRDDAPEREARLKAAGDAMIAYEAAFSATQDAHEKAGLPAPAEDFIDLPPKCQVPRSIRSHDALPPTRHPQIAIIIGNPETGSSYMGVKLDIRFSDGSSVLAESGPGGWAMLPVQPGKSVSAVGLTVDIEEPARFTVPARLDGPGILIIDINPEALAVRNLEPTALVLASDGSLNSDKGSASYRKF